MKFFIYISNLFNNQNKLVIMGCHNTKLDEVEESINKIKLNQLQVNLKFREDIDEVAVNIVKLQQAISILIKKNIELTDKVKQLYD